MSPFVIASDLSAEARRAKAEAKQSISRLAETWIASSLSLLAMTLEGRQRDARSQDNIFFNSG
jgi:hypothetical protein